MASRGYLGRDAERQRIKAENTLRRELEMAAREVELSKREAEVTEREAAAKEERKRLDDRSRRLYKIHRTRCARLREVGIDENREKEWQARLYHAERNYADCKEELGKTVNRLNDEMHRLMAITSGSKAAEFMARADRLHEYLLEACLSAHDRKDSRALLILAEAFGQMNELIKDAQALTAIHAQPPQTQQESTA